MLCHDEFQSGRADAIFTYDPAIVTDRGAIVMSMGKALRRGEEDPMARRLEELGVPTLYRLHGGATAEGVQPVGVTVRILPRRLPDGKLHLAVTLLDEHGVPWTDGEPLDRTLRRTVDPGEGITHRLISRGGALTYTFSVTPYY